MDTASTDDPTNWTNGTVCKPVLSSRLPIGLMANYWQSVGSLQVASTIPSTPTNITYSVGGGQMTLSWPVSYAAWILQEQTNALNVGLSTNWVNIGVMAGTTTTVSLNTAGLVFYRLRHP